MYISIPVHAKRREKKNKYLNEVRGKKGERRRERKNKLNEIRNRVLSGVLMKQEKVVFLVSLVKNLRRLTRVLWKNKCPIKPKVNY